MPDTPDDPDTWSELEDLLLACLEQPDDQRDQALAALCAQHPQHAATLRQRYARLHELGFVGAALPRPLQAGERFADYRLLRRLGGGAMGVVYLAEHTVTQGLVALKVLRADLHEQPRARERFRRELIAAAKVEHPGLCPVLHAGEADGRAFLVMRYVAGESLAQVIARSDAAMAGPGAVTLQPEHTTATPSTPAPPPDAATERARVLATVAMAEQVARALHAAHEQGLVHRDVKPANILIGSDGAPVVVDFGLVRDDDAGDPTLTVSSDPLGTPAYMAPEQIEPKGRRCDGRTDVHALGAVLFECLTRQRPYGGDSRAALYRAILGDAAPDARQHNPRVGRDLAVVVQKALEKDPARRYATALAFADDLRRVRLHEPVQARRTAAWLRLCRWAQRNPALAGAVGSLFLALAAGLAITLGLLAEVQRALAAREPGDLAAASTQALAHDTAAAMHIAAAAVQQWPDEPVARDALYAAAGELRERHCRTLDSPYSLATPTDGRFAVVASDQTAQTWVLRPGQEPVELATQGAGHFHLHRAVVSPDGRRVLALSRGRWQRDAAGQPVRAPGTPATLWDPEQPARPLAVLEHPVEVLAGCFLPDGSIATGATDGVVRLWTPEGALRHTLPGHDGPVAACSASPDGAVLVTGGHDRTARRWDPVRGVAIGAPIAHGGQVVAVAWAPVRPGIPDRFLTATGYDSRRTWRDDPGFADDRGRVFDRDGRLLAELGRHRHRLEGACWAPDGVHVLTFGADYEAQLWHVPHDGGAHLVRSLPHDATVYDAAFDASGERLATVTFAGTVMLWDRTGRPVATLRGHRLCGTGCAFVDDALVTTALDHTVRTWNLTPTFVPTWSTGLLSALTTARDGRWLVCVDADGRVTIHDREMPHAAALHTFASGLTNVTTVASDHDGTHLVLGDENGSLHHFAPDGTRPRPAWRAHDRQVKHVQFRPGAEHLLLSASYDGRVRLFDLRSPDDTPVVDLVPAPAPAVRANPALGRHGDPVWCASFSPDGRRLAAATDDRPEYAVRLWDVDALLANPQSPPQHVLVDHDPARSVVRSLAFSPDGHWLVCGTLQGNVSRWDLTTGRSTTMRVERDVTAVAVGPDGAPIACGSIDGSVQVLDGDLQRAFALPPQPGRIKGLMLSAAGPRLVVGTRGGRVTDWPTTTSALLRDWHAAPAIRAFQPEQSTVRRLRPR